MTGKTRIEQQPAMSFFLKHYRQVEHQNGDKSMQYAALKKIYKLTLLARLFRASNKRHLEFISASDNKEVACKRLDKVQQEFQRLQPVLQKKTLPYR